MNEENKIIENESDVNSETPMIFAEKTKVIINKTNNKFLKGFYIFIFYFANIFVDFIRSCKKNPSKIAGILVAAPGVFIGFLLGIQTNAMTKIGETGMAPLALFFLVLFGAVNIFNASGIITKRNIGSVITSSLVTLIIDIFGVFYIINMFNCISDAKSKPDFSITPSIIVSLVTVMVSMLLSTIGCVLAFIFRDKTYEKDRS